MAKCGETRKEIEDLQAKSYIINMDNMKNKPLIDQVSLLCIKPFETNSIWIVDFNSVKKELQRWRKNIAF